jgi:hypothetical protein
MKQIAALALVAILAVSQTACTKDEVTATLGGLVNAAIAAADVVQPQDAALLNGITSQCIDPAINELASSDTGAQKSIAILSACTPEVALLGNSPGLQAVSAALAAFLDSVKGLTASAQSTPSYALAFAGSTSAAKIDKAKLKKIRAQVDLLKAKLATRKK